MYKSKVKGTNLLYPFTLEWKDNDENSDSIAGKELVVTENYDKPIQQQM